MTFIDLCAGIGGISLGLERAGMTCIGQVEYDAFCNRILARHWPDVPRWGDITALDPACLPAADLIAGGYPCQPFSLAGERRGAEDDRHLWPYVRKIVAHIRPAWCLFENVAGHVTLGLDEVLTEMEALGYTCGPLVIPACAVDAPHRRDRVWILAHSGNAQRWPRVPVGHVLYGEVVQRQKAASGATASGADGGGGILANTVSLGRREGWAESAELRREAGLVHGGASVADSVGEGFGAGLRPGVAPGERWGRSGNRSGEAPDGGTDWPTWPTEPCVGRVAHGVPNRVDRLRGLGNAVVPQLVEVIGKAILAAHYEQEVPHVARGHGGAGSTQESDPAHGPQRLQPIDLVGA